MKEKYNPTEPKYVNYIYCFSCDEERVDETGDICETCREKVEDEE